MAVVPPFRKHGIGWKIPAAASKIHFDLHWPAEQQGAGVCFRRFGFSERSNGRPSKAAAAIPTAINAVMRTESRDSVCRRFGTSMPPERLHVECCPGRFWATQAARPGWKCAAVCAGREEGYRPKSGQCGVKMRKLVQKWCGNLCQNRKTA